MYLLLPTLLMLACEPAPPEPDADHAAFVTLLGADTLAVEQFNWTPTRMEADVVLRTPTTSLRHYVLETDAEGALQRFEASIHNLSALSEAPPQQTDIVTVDGDSLLMLTREGEAMRAFAVAGDASMLPFLDMIHWPFEMMLRRAYTAAADSTTQHVFTGRNTFPFTLHRLEDGSMTVTHPFRGTMNVRVDKDGRLLHLDAGATTRKLIVERVPDIQVEALAARFASLDAAGQSFGALSTRGQAEAVVKGATLTLDFGVPSKRGRDIFGALVPWGTLWRTGANRATHFSTDRDLIVGGLPVPAGSYTLYTIPEPSGGTLIINRQTGQNGTTYNEDQDLGRVPMTIRQRPDVVEAFTISVREAGGGGLLELAWDRTSFEIPFTVR